MRVLVTRAQEDAARTAARLRELGHEPILSPVLHVAPTGAALPHEVFDAVLATSAHAFEGVGTPPHAWEGAALLVVGARTAERARAAGFGEAEAVAPDVVTLLAAMDERFPEPFRFLYLAGRDRKSDLETGLRARGHEVVIVETYEAQAAPAFTVEARAALEAGAVDAALHYSRRSAVLFCRLVVEAGLEAPAAKAVHLAISADAAAPLQARGWPARIAATPEEEALLALLD